jgi:enoyl-CoA hydratase
MTAVTYESFDRIAVVTIDQPEKRNALSKQVVDELAEAWRRFAGSGDRVAVLTATGDKAFTVGADLNDVPHDLWRAVPGIGVEIHKPIVGAVAGWVVGGGLVLANHCDLLVAAQYDVPLSRSQGRFFRWPHIVARSAAMLPMTWAA